VSVRKAYESTPSGRKSTAQFNSVNYPLKKQPKKLHKGKATLVGLGLLGISLISAVVGAFLAVTVSDVPPLRQTELSKEEQQVFSETDMVAANLNLPELKRPVNILLLGIKVVRSDLENRGIAYEKQDVGYDHLVNSFHGLSDSMLLLRFDPEEEKVSVLSIPRDTRVNIEGYGIRKINHANDYGGPALTAKVAGELLGGVKIDRYVRVNVQGVEKLIDALGGITVNVPKDMKYTDFSQHLYIDLKKGVQHLDGDKTMQFLRFRYDEYGDISRVQRQQMLMRSAVEQTLKPATIVKIPKILSVIQSHLDTNLTVRELMALSNFASKTDRSDIQMMMLPGDFNDPGDRVSYWLPNDEKIHKLMTEHFELPKNDSDYLAIANSRYAALEGGTGISHPRLRISIQDSTDSQTALQASLDTLRDAGYRQVSASKNWQASLPVTRIIAQSGDNEAAQEVRSILGLGEIVVESTGVLGSDVTVQLGRDWKKQQNQQNQAAELGTASQGDAPLPNSELRTRN
jgi:polyisoprenyl-teichoic acid--peptidoglycan teichoic acid transferase